jgi:glycine oxidase
MRDGATVDVAVAGGGIVGLAIAWAARERGLSVVVLERDHIGAGASHVAAGMLAPVSEADYGDAAHRLLQLGLRSAAMWPGFAERLQRAAGIELGLRRTGTLIAARDADEARELERQLELRRSLGLPVLRLRGSEAREREPGLAPTVRLALEAPDDHAVDPRVALDALREACERSGVLLRERAPVVRVAVDPPRGVASDHAPQRGGRERRARGFVLASGEHVSAERVVIAAGAWSASIGGLGQQAPVPVRPVKGQIVRLRDPSGPGLLERVLRFHGGYVVPRGDGRYVLGATVEERGFELSATVGAVYELLRDAHELLPGVSELEIEELSVGLRPGTPDNAPVIGEAAIAGLIWACGHHRNGILLAPLTAELVVGLLAGDAGSSVDGGEGAAIASRGRDLASGRLGAGHEALLRACSPARFAADREPAARAAAVAGASPAHTSGAEAGAEVTA